MSFETYVCEQCGDSFIAFEDAQATQTAYCSPRCESSGNGLS